MKQSKSLESRIKNIEKIHIKSLPDEYFPTILQSSLNLTIRILISIYLISVFGIILGCILTITASRIFELFICNLNKLESTTIQDKGCIGKQIIDGFTLAGNMAIEDYDAIELKKEIRKKLFSQIKKLNARLVCYLCDFYWTTPQVKYNTEAEKEAVFN